MPIKDEFQKVVDLLTWFKWKLMKRFWTNVTPSLLVWMKKSKFFWMTCLCTQSSSMYSDFPFFFSMNLISSLSVIWTNLLVSILEKNLKLNFNRRNDQRKLWKHQIGKPQLLDNTWKYCEVIGQKWCHTCVDTNDIITDGIAHLMICYHTVYHWLVYNKINYVLNIFRLSTTVTVVWIRNTFATQL